MIELTYLIGDKGDPEALERLEAFDLYLKMEPYRIVCPCIGQEAVKRAELSPEVRDIDSILEYLEEQGPPKEAVREMAPELPETYSVLSDPQAEGTIDELSRRYLDFPRGQLLDLVYRTKVMKRRRSLIVKSRAGGDPLYEKSDPDCEECFGKGWLMTSANPQGYWRSWEMNGALYLAGDPECDLATEAIECALCNGGKGDCHRCWGVGHWIPIDQVDPEKHCCQGDDLLSMIDSGQAPIPTVIIDSNGNYLHRNGTRFGKHPSLAEREWVEELTSLLRCNTCWIWPIDCHT
jgi:hypothetical protein